MFDKKEQRFSQVPIRSVAQSSNYYDESVETRLAQKIEAPSNPIIEKVLSRKAIDNSERTLLALYLLTMGTRGPRMRRQIEEISPKILNDVCDEQRAKSENEIIEAGEDPDGHPRIAEVEEMRGRFLERPPEQVATLARTPYFSIATLECVHNMVWRIIQAPADTHFITGDTPTHISEHAGVGTSTSELSFPISKEFALIGSHTGKPATIEYVPPQENIVNEVNRRICACAERFLFSHVEADWIRDFAVNPQEINRIHWL